MIWIDNRTTFCMHPKEYAINWLLYYPISTVLGLKFGFLFWRAGNMLIQEYTYIFNNTNFKVYSIPNWSLPKAEPLIVKENFVTQWKHNNCFFLFNFFFFSNEQDVASQVARVCPGLQAADSSQGWELRSSWIGVVLVRVGTWRNRSRTKSKNSFWTWAWAGAGDASFLNILLIPKNEPNTRIIKNKVKKNKNKNLFIIKKEKSTRFLKFSQWQQYKIINY